MCESDGSQLDGDCGGASEERARVLGEARNRRRVRVRVWSECDGQEREGAGDDEGGAQGDEDAPQVGVPFQIVQGKRQDAEAEDGDPAPARQAESLTEAEHDDGSDEGGAAAHDGVAEGKIDFLVGGGDADVIGEVAAAGKGQERPAGDRKRWEERQDEKCAETSAQCIEG